MKKHKPVIESPKPAAFPEETFFKRWSQRKLEGASSIETDQSANEQAHIEHEPPVDSSNDSELPSDQTLRELTDEDMPPLETLDENSDFSGFFSPRVSEALRRQALQKLFHLPQFNIVDGLNDYDEDYTQFESLGGIVTHEMKRIIRRESEQLKENIQETNSVRSDNGEEVGHRQQEAVAPGPGTNESQGDEATDEDVTARSANDT